MRIEDAVMERHIEVMLAEPGAVAWRASARPALQPPVHAHRTGLGRTGLGRTGLGRMGLALLGVAIVVGVAWFREEAQPASHPDPLRGAFRPALTLQDTVPSPLIARSAADLERLSANLEELEVRRLPGAAFPALRRFTNLQQLTISGALDEEDDALFHRAWSLPRTVASTFVLLPTLRSLTLLAVDDLQRSDLEALVGLPRLEAVHLRAAQAISNEFVTILAAVKGLRRLTLEADGGDFSTAGVAALARIPKLEELRVRGIYALEKADYLRLAGFAQLQVLDVSAPWYLGKPSLSSAPWPTAVVDDVDDEFVAKAARLPHLRELGLGARRRVTDAGLHHLASTQLESIDLHQCARITGAGLASLPATLQVLDVHECLGLTSLPSHFTALRQLTATFAAGLTDDIAESLRDCRELQVLDLSNCPGLTKKVSDVLPRLTALRRLALRAQPWIDDDVAAQCAGLPQLEELNLGSTVGRFSLPSGDAYSGGVTKLTARGVESLSSLQSLRVLHLAAAPPLPIAALRRLSKLPLRRLNLSWTNVEYDDETRSLAELRRAFAGAKVDWFDPETNRWPK